MFYLKHNGEKLPIEGGNVYTICPECGREHAVDLQEILEGGSADLYGTAVYCEECSARREAVRQGPDSTLQQIAADFAVPEWLAVQLARNALDNCLTRGLLGGAAGAVAGQRQGGTCQRPGHRGPVRLHRRGGFADAAR